MEAWWETNQHYLLLFLVGSLLAVVGIYRNIKIEKIRKNGIKTVAHIVDYDIKTKFTTFNNNYTFKTLYYPVIRFTDSNGVHQQLRDDSFGTSIKPGKKLPFELSIHYIDNNGKIEMITENKLNDIFAMGIAIAGICMVITSLFLFFCK